jgi:hypothetical protein
VAVPDVGRSDRRYGPEWVNRLTEAGHPVQRARAAPTQGRLVGEPWQLAAVRIPDEPPLGER